MPRSASKFDDIVDLVMPRYLESVTDAESKPFSERWNRVLRTIQAVEESRGRRDVTGNGLRPQHPDGVILGAQESGWKNDADRLVLPYFPSASDPSDRHGLLRLVNRSSRSGKVTIEAIDDTGTTSAPLTFSLDAAAVLHLNSAELEQGNAAKGLHTGTGPGQGAWVLALSSTVPIDTYAYIQSSGGYVTPINDTVPAEDGRAIVTYPTSGDDTDLQNMLRLVNRNAEPVAVKISQVDELGSRKSGVTVELRAHQARTYSLDELATGETPGVSGFSDEFSGIARRVAIESTPGVLAMSFATSNAGHLTHLSGLSTDQETRSVPLFMSASDPYRRQGLIRVVNRESRPGTLSIQAFDDSGRKYEVITLALDANRVVEIDSDDLELGNPAKGLPIGTGSGEGDWRLEFTSELDLEVAPFVRTSDGLRTPMHDTVTGTEKRYEIAWFKAVDDSKQVGVLRLINVSHQPVDVTIQGTDDTGERHGVARLTISPHASRTLTATELERGAERLNGRLGDGRGDWRLAISTDTPIEVMNLLATATGHLTNLTTPALSIGSSQSSDAEETAESVFESDISPIIQDDCIECHVAGGRADQISRLVFVDDSDPEHLVKNLGEFQALLDEEDADAQHILNKIQNIGGHGGGVRIRAGTVEFKAMVRFLELLGEEVEEGPSITPETLFEGVTLESDRQTLRRAAIVFAGRVPTDDEYASLVDGDEDSLRVAIRGLMQGPGFHDFLIRGSNDRLLTDRGGTIIDAAAQNDFVAFANLYHEKSISGLPFGELYSWSLRAQYGFRRAPLELISYVAMNDLPYTEVLTADYIMANPPAAEAYGASTIFDDENNIHEFKPSEIVSYYRDDESKVSTYSFDTGTHISEPGNLITDYPHAGILNTTVFLLRYPSTATNRNRARSRWTYYHFLGLDIEKSASRTTDPLALADVNNPTMHNPACTVCHTVLDPVAGAFQNYGDAGFYRDQWRGLDSLDSQYKSNERNAEFRSVNARTWEERETFIVDAWLAAGSRTVGLATKSSHNIHVDYLLVRDGETVVTKQELEDSDNQDCGSARDESYELVHCALVVDIEIPVSGMYSVEVAAFVGYDYDEVPGRPARLAIWVPFDENYQFGDTWYRDMRSPGIGDEVAPSSENSVQWLAERIIEDERFADATVKFWWPALMGNEVVEPPEEADDADIETARLAANAQAAEVQRLARGFESGFGEGNPFNLKDLLVELSLSPWFRAMSVAGDVPLRSSALRLAGAKRLLTPAELANKTRHLTGFQWGRYRDQSWRTPDEEGLSSLTVVRLGYALLYGGIDSDGVTERAREMTSTMAGVAQSHAAESSCPIVMRELFLLEDDERRLFQGFDRHMTPVREFGETLTINAESRSEIETFSVEGSLRMGEITIKMAYLNDYWGGPNEDRDVLLDRLRVLRDDEVIFDLEMEDHDQETGCHHLQQDALHLSKGGSDCVLAVPVDIPITGIYSIELAAWGDQAGDEAPRLAVSVESNFVNSAGSIAIRTQLVSLYENLLGVSLEIDSKEVRTAYELFVEVWQANLNSDRMRMDFRKWQDVECDWENDHYFLDEVLDDAWVVLDDPEEGNERVYGWDHEHISSYFETVDFSDPHGVARTWVVVMTYLLMDYRYLYL